MSAMSSSVERKGKEKKQKQKANTETPVEILKDSLCICNLKAPMHSH